MAIAHAIKRHREALEMTQEELARALGLKRATIATYETGGAKPSLMVILTMARVFQVSIESLLTDEIPAEDPTLQVLNTPS